MIIYNTTYQVDESVNDNFIIWIRECYIEVISKDNVLRSPKMMKVLSHNEEGYTYCLQWEIEDSKTLHKWYSEQGGKLISEVNKIFGDKVTMFSTLLEVM